MQKITPCLWFDTQAEEAANFYVSLFEDSEVTDVQRLDGTPSGDNVALVFFRLAGQEYMAINGGPQFPFTEAVSFNVSCKDQDEVDRLWSALTADGGKESQCGWLQDRFGLSWQIIPERMGELLSDPIPRAPSGRCRPCSRCRRSTSRCWRTRPTRRERDPGRASSVSSRSDRGGGANG